MAVKFELPAEIEQALRTRVGDLDRAAKEAALAELFRSGRLSHAELGQALGLSRDGVDGFLKRHHVATDLLSVVEHESQLDSLRRLAG